MTWDDDAIPLGARPVEPVRSIPVGGTLADWADKVGLSAIAPERVHDPSDLEDADPSPPEGVLEVDQEPAAILEPDRQPVALPDGFGTGWEAYEVCPLEAQGDPARRGGLVIGHSDTHVVVMRYERRRSTVALRQQSIPRTNIDPARICEPDRRNCHRHARLIAVAIAGGKGDLDDDDRLWLAVMNQLAYIR